MVSNNISIHLHAIFYHIGYFRQTTRSFIFRALARYNFIVRNSNSPKTNVMSISFFIIGGVIFSIYMYFTIWNIFYSNKKQKEENYPNITGKEIPKKNDL